MSDLKIIQTGDGSASLLNPALNETYHSVHGALQESVHVFIEHGLRYFLEANQKQVVSILEVGFGTGLNAWLTVKAIQGMPRMVQYTTLEILPIEKTIWSQLGYAQTQDDMKLFKSLHEASWNLPVHISPQFELTKLQASLQTVAFPQNHFDVVYFDAFAPNKQPEMWTMEMLSKVAGFLKTDGVFVTYCAKGQLKRDLRSLGMVVETLSGPPGKKEMVRAVKR